ncbi:MAG: hypothetical protein AABW86_03745 [Candidatus Micrarchaeota archaeon]
MFAEIAYSIVLGKTVIFWTGTLAFLTLISGAGIAFFKKPIFHKNYLDDHKIIVKIGILFAILHAILAIGAYL